MTGERVSRVIAQIGEEAKVVARKADEATGRRIKCANASRRCRKIAFVGG
jgi:hypothetical protein